MVLWLKAFCVECECFFWSPITFPFSHVSMPLFLPDKHTQTHTLCPISSAQLSLSLCFRWCRCCGRLIEMREEMTALCISASLQSPTLPSTSASGTAAVGTQSFPSLSFRLSLILFVCLLIPFLCRLHTRYSPLPPLSASSQNPPFPSFLLTSVPPPLAIHLPIVLPTVTHSLSHTRTHTLIFSCEKSSKTLELIYIMQLLKKY